MLRLGYFLIWLCLFFMPVGQAHLHDPTRPVNIAGLSSPSEAQAWGLQAIIIAKGHRVAILNGRPLHVGSPLARFKVVAIRPNAVHLEGPDGKLTLFLFNQTIKMPVAQ